MDATVKTEDLFDDLTLWSFAPIEACQREKIVPNELAYREDRSALALFVKRGRSGSYGGPGGFALMEGGLNYLIDAMEKGQTNKGKLVAEAWVVLVEASVKLSQSVRIVDQCTATEMKRRLVGVTPSPSQYWPGRYWWATPKEVNADWM
jgi:hypothetical protein